MVPLDPSNPAGPQTPIYYELSTPRQPSLGSVVVFHGGPGYPRQHLNSLGPLWEGLRSHFHILYFHQRGSGFSGAIHRREDLDGKEPFYTLDAFVEDSYILATALLPHHRYILFGKSAGGFLALKFALAHPGETQALILAATAAYHGYLSARKDYEEQFFDQLERRHRGFLDRRDRAVALLQGESSASPAWKVLLGDAAGEILDSVVLDLSYTLEGQFELVALVEGCSRGDYSLLLKRTNQGRKTLGLTGMESQGILQLVSCRELLFGRSSPGACEGTSEGTPYDVRGRLPEITSPVLVLSGLYDPILPPIFQEEIARGVSGPTQWRVFELSGHMLFTEQPRLTSEVILRWLGLELQQVPQDSSL